MYFGLFQCAQAVINKVHSPPKYGLFLSSHEPVLIPNTLTLPAIVALGLKASCALTSYPGVGRSGTVFIRFIGRINIYPRVC